MLGHLDALPVAVRATFALRAAERGHRVLAVDDRFVVQTLRTAGSILLFSHIILFYIHSLIQNFVNKIVTDLVRTVNGCDHFCVALAERGRAVRLLKDAHLAAELAQLVRLAAVDAQTDQWIEQGSHCR